MATQTEQTFQEYPGFTATVLQHPNGLSTSILKRHGNPIAHTKVPTDLETLLRWSRAYIQQVLAEEQKNDSKTE